MSANGHQESPQDEVDNPANCGRAALQTLGACRMAILLTVFRSWKEFIRRISENAMRKK
jgi:hypothetical protein